jgi:uncharacterized protein YndB with AHSA1/START domain
MSTQVQELVVRKSITIDAPAAHVFTVFSEHFDAWWPRKQHIGRTEKFSAILEPRVGGRWYEKSVDGSECDWGRVLAWDPPRVLEHEWIQPGLDISVVRYDLEADAGGTILRLTHRRSVAPGATGGRAGWYAYLDRLAARLDGLPVPAWSERRAEVQDAYGEAPLLGA